MKKTKEQYIAEIMEYVDKMSLTQKEEFLSYLKNISVEADML